MFQYAFGRKISVYNDKALNLLIIGEAGETKTSRRYQLDSFAISGNILRGTQKKAIELLLSCGGRKATNVLNNYYNYVNLPIVKHPTDNYNQKYDGKLIKEYGFAIFDGYWQNEKYFLDIEDTIRKDFEHIDSMSSRDKEIKNKIYKRNSVAVHFRRLHDDENQLYGKLPKSYYEQSLHMMKERVDDITFFVFGDDIEWAKQNFFHDESVVYIDHNNYANAHRDMLLMSYCDHQVISNSTFSWWGAWLNDNNEKTVISPKWWFKDDERNCHQDIIPSRWIKNG
ncbi:hypothetical protein GGP91_002137 [Salinibacter ruber]|nr:hypothetical protein [Salinibacter ruber]